MEMAWMNTLYLRDSNNPVGMLGIALLLLLSVPAGAEDARQLAIPGVYVDRGGYASADVLAGEEARASITMRGPSRNGSTGSTTARSPRDWTGSWSGTATNAPAPKRNACSHASRAQTSWPTPGSWRHRPGSSS